MIISNSLTIGQLTFIIRVVISLLSYASLVFIPIIILAHAPRVAPVDTHHVINHAMGASSATLSTAWWIIDRVRGKFNKPTAPTSASLVLVLLLTTSYTIFVPLSDVGFLGFYSCSVPGPDSVDFPASIASDDAARSLLSANMVNGTDLAAVTAWRCDTTELVKVANDTFNNCTAWHTSTYADLNLFSGINSTDSDTLLPRQLKRRSKPAKSGIPSSSNQQLNSQDPTDGVNSFYVGPDTQRLRAPTIRDGIAVEPHATGLRAVFGVPQLGLNKTVTISKTMAMELDVGCMSLGVYGQEEVDAVSHGIQWIVLDDSWKMYTGPDYMRDVLAKTADDVRAYIRPLFGANLTMPFYDAPGSAAKVGGYTLPFVGKNIDTAFTMLDNCTDAFQKQLGIPIIKQRGNMCGYLGIGGSTAMDGRRGTGYHRMVCAAATQVNMVSATVSVDGLNKTSLNITRLPSDLHYLQADYRNASGQFVKDLIPYERYTLDDNPNGPINHFIRHRNYAFQDSQVGQASGGNAIAAVGSVIIDRDNELKYSESAGLQLLDDGFDPISDFSTGAVTEWVGQVAGSFVLATLTYNGWAARQMQSILVQSTGGRMGSCYKPYHALGFLPLVCVAIVSACWAGFVLIRTSLWGWAKVKDAYAGLAPFIAVAYRDAPPNDSKTLLLWEHLEQPILKVASKGYPVTGDPDQTALEYFRSTQSNQS